MARIFSRSTEQRQRTLGRLSDGSDRQLVTETVVVVRTDAGDCEFDHEPTDQEVLDALPRPTDLVPTRKADLEDFLQGPFARWQRWKATREEAQARAVAAAVITALQSKEDAAWTNYLQAINQWRNAT